MGALRAPRAIASSSREDSLSFFKISCPATPAVIAAAAKIPASAWSARTSSTWTAPSAKAAYLDARNALMVQLAPSAVREPLIMLVHATNAQRAASPARGRQSVLIASEDTP